MERMKQLGRFQKGVLVVLIAVVTIFTILYSIAFSKIGFVDEDAFMEKRTDGENTVYTGNVNGYVLSYTITKDNAVYCHYGENTYGPYTVRKDPTAVPKNDEQAEDMVGVEIREGEEILSRGGVLVIDGKIRLYKESTEVSNDPMALPGNIYGSHKPTAQMILYLLSGPKLVKGGNIWYWIGGVIAAALTAFSVIFAEELFAFALSFRIRYAELAEPSDWEIVSRYAGWALGVFATPIIFLLGLTMYI